LENGHSFGKTDDVLKILHLNEDGIHGHKRKISYKETAKGNQLNNKQFPLKKNYPNHTEKVT